jgi:hypothetical protein
MTECAIIRASTVGDSLSNIKSLLMLDPAQNDVFLARGTATFFTNSELVFCNETAMFRRGERLL